MRLIALWSGKLAYLMLKLTHHHGAALPGLIAEKVNRNFIRSSLNKLPEGVVIVTGTNGKTTTTKMLTSLLRSKKRVLTNPTGSNFTRGIASSVVRHSSWSGKLDYDMGVFELDEAYAAKFAEDYEPRATIVLNVMRDQMDRFGEIDHTARLIKKVVAATKEFVVLNADDRRVAALSGAARSKIEWFGVDETLRKLYKNDDELYDQTLTNEQTKSAVNCLLLSFDNYSGKTEYLINQKKASFILNGATTYNAQNVASVVVAAMNIGLDIKEISDQIPKIKPAFGRGEHIEIEGKKLILQLVKNPGGFRQALISAKNIGNDATMIAINDDYADGRDVSWLWDVDFKHLNGSTIITSGTRAADMALRLKYDEKLAKEINPNLNEALSSLLKKVSPNGVCVVFTTYTAMLQLRRILTGKAMVD